MSFKELGLSEPILRSLKDLDHSEPSEIQTQAIPLVLEGKNIMAAAQTGTGKTGSFVLPMIELLQERPKPYSKHVHALILTPTRELAAQVRESVYTYGKYTSTTSTAVFGGAKIFPQKSKLKKGLDILVATPGRLLDLVNQKAVKLNNVQILVLDEADHMLDMGFIHDIKKILRLLPKQRQNLLFSATFSNDIRNLAKGLVHNPIEISVSPPNTTVESVEHWIYSVDKNKKSPLLIHLIKENQWPQVLVFSRTKHGANKLAKQLTGAGLNAAAIHGNKSQGARTRALAEFKSGEVQVLVATDIAARGLDIEQLPNVVNFDLPNVPEDYVHRIGRTGRAGASGMAVSLVSADEFKQLSDIERLIGELLPRKAVEGFEPVHALQESRLNTRPHKPKKPKKPKTGHRDGQRSGENAQGHKKDRPSGNSQRRKSAGDGAKPAANPNSNRRRRKPVSGNR